METLYLFSYLFMIFFITSCVGYVCEVVYCSIVDNYFEWNRGFLLGPYVPLYGVGAIAIFYFLRNYYDQPLALFLLTFFICTVLEYVTSYVMEKLFKIRWWDYSWLPFNIEGRVCLLNSVLFGVAGLVVVYLLRPLLLNLFNHVPPIIMISAALVFGTLFLLDLLFTTITLISIRTSITDLEEVKGDGTGKAKEQVLEKIRKNAAFYNVLIRAFPYIDGADEKSFKELRILVNTVKKTLMVGKGAGTSVVSGTKKVAVKTKKVVASTAGKIKTTTMGKRTSKVSNKK